MRSARSYTTTSWPARVSCWAAASPDGPEPMTATRLPVVVTGATGSTHPASHAVSTMVTSTCLMVTGSSLMPSTHADSHGAGHRRPVNSGKLLVACSRSLASCQSSRNTRSFHSGIRFPSGQPLWQNGIPQFMHRDACMRSRSGSNGSYTSCQSWTRTGIGRRVGVSRRCFRKPVTSPMCGLHHQLVGIEALCCGALDGRQDSLEVLREHLQPRLRLPIVEHPRCELRARELAVALDGAAQPRPVLVGQRVEVDHVGVDPRRCRAVWVA